MTVLLRAEGLRKTFVLRRNAWGQPSQTLQATKDLTIVAHAGETVGLVGESGAGKSTAGRLLLRLIEPDAGTIQLGATDVRALRGKALRAFHGRARMIFQDPFSSLDPKMSIGASVAEPLLLHDVASGSERRARVSELFERVGLSERQMHRFPHEFSGGQLQRVAIARALATSPELIVCDEPVAALDMSIRAQVINLLSELQAEHGIAYIFISHDLSLVRMIADVVAVMYRGRIVEQGPATELFNSPLHPYTRTLLAAIPSPDPALRRARRDRPAMGGSDGVQIDLAGCDYADRCPLAMPVCREVVPTLLAAGGSRGVACHAVAETTVTFDPSARRAALPSDGRSRPMVSDRA